MSCRNTSEKTIPCVVAAADRLSSHCSCDDSAAVAVMIDDYVMTAVAADVVWNFSLSASAPDRWSVADLAEHCRQTALEPGRSTPPNRWHIPGVLCGGDKKSGEA